jgi:hypothetical protein
MKGNKNQMLYVIYEKYCFFYEEEAYKYQNHFVMQSLQNPPLCSITFYNTLPTIARVLVQVFQ